MTGGETVPHRIESIPIHALRLTVTEGPDAGRSFKAQGATITVGTADSNDLVLTDDTVSRYHLEIRRKEDRIEVQDLGSTNGTRFQTVRLERAVVVPGTIVHLGKTALRIDDGDTVEVEVHEEDRLAGFRGRTPEMRRLMATVKRVAKSDVSVLILGETGTGKEVLARSIHEASNRAGQPFETVDCGSLLPTLVASELFGHERGAFTGAEQRHVGAFERAQGGTIFLDEIGELPPALQPTLLGALERRSFRRVGGTKPISVDVRVICATNRDLRAEVNNGTFRADLYYRIAVVLLQLPPLRDRADDIPILVEHFARENGHEGQADAIIPDSVMQALKKYRWPGNVRELRNFVEAAIAMGEAPSISGGAPAPASGSGGELAIHLELRGLDDHKYKETREAVLREFERLFLGRLMERTNGNVALAAREADMDRTYLMQVLKRLGIGKKGS